MNESDSSLEARSTEAPVLDLPTLAVLCSVFNEEKAIPLFLERLLPVFQSIEQYCQPRLYFIDNGSSDASLPLIREFHAQYPNIFVIVLSRNFGYECALETGLRIANEDLYVMIDVDCEDPPDMIHDFVLHWRTGYDIVYGERSDRPETLLIKSARKIYYRLVRLLADDNFVLDMAEFSLISREVRDAIIQDATAYPFIRASIGRIGFRRKNLIYKRQQRIAGQSHYNFLGMMIFAVGGIMSASTVVLRMSAYSFPFWAAIMIIIGIWAIASPGNWQIATLLVVGQLFIGFTVTAAGLYIARIYKDGLRRPNAIVRLALSILPLNAQLPPPPVPFRRYE